MSFSDEIKMERDMLDQAEDVEFDPEMVVAQLLEDKSVVQHVTRTLTEEAESVVGYFRVGFAKGQQRAVIHFPLTPQLGEIPSVEAMLLDPVPGRVRITDRQRFGIRIEVALQQPVEANGSVMIEVIVTAAAKSKGVCE